MKTEATAPVIAVEGLTFSYGGREPVLEDVTFSLPPLDFVSLIGPNGGGKTTLLKLILGLLEPSSGRVRVFGTSPAAARRRIGYLAQSSDLDPRFPVQVLDVVLMGRLGPHRRLGPFSRADRRAAGEILDRVGLAGLERRPFSTLSGGQRQRLLLARALVSDPDLLLLDEPAAGLDQKVEQDFLTLLRELNREKTLVLVSHDLGFVSTFVRTAICVHRTVDVHPPSELDDTMIKRLFGRDVRLIEHDHAW